MAAGKPVRSQDPANSAWCLLKQQMLSASSAERCRFLSSSSCPQYSFIGAIDTTPQISCYPSTFISARDCCVVSIPAKRILWWSHTSAMCLLRHEVLCEGPTGMKEKIENPYIIDSWYIMIYYIFIPICYRNRKRVSHTLLDSSAIPCPLIPWCCRVLTHLQKVHSLGAYLTKHVHCVHTTHTNYPYRNCTKNCTKNCTVFLGFFQECNAAFAPKTVLLAPMFKSVQKCGFLWT